MTLTAVWKEVDENPSGLTFDELETKVYREYSLSNIKPVKYTSLKYQVDFNYIKQDDGVRDEIKTKPGTSKVYKGILYETVIDESGNEVRQVVETQEPIYKKEVYKENIYTVEKVRNEVLSQRGVN